MTDSAQHCPRRIADGYGPDSPFKTPKDGDIFFKPQNDVYSRCSYCGSMSEEDFFDAITKKIALGPTDKKYKVYVGDFGKFYFQHLSVDGQRRFIELYNAREVKFSEPGIFYVLPFFMQVKK